MASSNQLFQQVQDDLQSIKSTILQLRALQLTERERVTVDHIENAVKAFDAIEEFHPKRDPSAEQRRLDANIAESQRISKI